MGHNLMVDKDFFKRYQKGIVWLFNTRFGKWYFNIQPKGKIIKVFPNAIRWDNYDGTVTSEFRTHNRFAYRMNTLLKWVPFLRWDFGYPQLQFGLTVTPFYPNANPESTSVDGRQGVNNYNGTWANIIAETTGTFGGDGDSSTQPLYILSDTTPNQWDVITRSFYLFDTSSIDDGDTIDSATFSLWPTAKVDSLGVGGEANSAWVLVSSNPASNTAIVSGDYDSLGSTSFGTSVIYNSRTTGAYNSITLNASGLSNISKTGVSKFGLKTGWDHNATAPTWSASSEHYETCFFAEQTGTENDPKLEVTHSVSTTEWYMSFV